MKRKPFSRSRQRVWKSKARRDGFCVAPWTPWHYALQADNAGGGAFTFAEIMAASDTQP